jgi:hypothetical protein
MINDSLLNTSVPPPVPVQYGRIRIPIIMGTWIRICVKVKGWILFCIKSKIQELKRLKNGAVDAHNGGVVVQNGALEGLYTNGRCFISLMGIRIRILVKSRIQNRIKVMDPQTLATMISK